MCLFWRKHRHRWSFWTQVERPESNESMLGIYRTTRTVNHRRCELCGYVQERKASD